MATIGDSSLVTWRATTMAAITTAAIAGPTMTGRFHHAGRALPGSLGATAAALGLRAAGCSRRRPPVAPATGTGCGDGAAGAGSSLSCLASSTTCLSGARSRCSSSSAS